MNCIEKLINKNYCYDLFLVFSLFILCIIPTKTIAKEIQSTSKLASPYIEDPTENKEKMKVWSRQLGVTCVYCHNLDNFKSDEKLTFKTAVKHSQMVRVLQEDVFNDRDKGNDLKVKVDCFMCHRGLEIPAFKEPPNALTKQTLKKPIFYRLSSVHKVIGVAKCSFSKATIYLQN